MRPRRRLALAAAALAATLSIAAGEGSAAASASAPEAPPALHPSRPPYRLRASVGPPVARLGERLLYRGGVSEGGPGSVRLLPLETGGAFTWGTPKVFKNEGWRRKALPQPYARYWDLDTMAYEIPLQIFTLGRLSIPGLLLEIDDGRGPKRYRLPMVELTVVPVLSAADSAAEFHALHGPLAAPWWERVPWTMVILGLLGVAAIVTLVVWRRPARAVQGTAPAASQESSDPLSEALAALEALRRLDLPEHGRFAEHAFRLGQILRRYLEAVTGTTRPGDTTPELVAHLRQAGLEGDDLARLSGLLRVWDRVKFAREPFSLEDAVRSERAAEAYLRRPPAAQVERVA